MTKFTQGKWIFDDEYIFTANKGWMIADVMAVRNKDEFNANGRLIAAAPEMYEILSKIVKFYSTGIPRIRGLRFRNGESVNMAKIEELLVWIDGEEENDD